MGVSMIIKTDRNMIAGKVATHNMGDGALFSEQFIFLARRLKRTSTVFFKNNHFNTMFKPRTLDQIEHVEEIAVFMPAGFSFIPTLY
ncbi:hypothetical protein L1987_34835 [Smallanthus sonchifolius]|uniref:Uncharacterized protein n=1 Tax=Smallanthus sonchifolius TaxID=185202 RepID=A0ACB9HVP6_9ASTR|nr:hypothetical protein L1987_34835 [Smallanthus sonchifolius]